MPTQTLWDLQVAYIGIKNAVLTLGARNIFDKQPADFRASCAFSSRPATTRRSTTRAAASST